MSSVLPKEADIRRDVILQGVVDALTTGTKDIISVNALIDHTSISAQEVEEHFGTPQGVVLALLSRLTHSMLAPLSKAPTPESFRPILLAFGHRVFDFYAAAQVRCLYRIALNEVPHDTSFGADFYRRGPGLLRSEVARFLQSAHACGLVLEADMGLLAGQLLALLRNHMDLFGPLRAASAGGSSVGHGHVLRIIDMFCTGIQSKGLDAHVAV